ncbi:MAG: hypothetical protein ABW190_00540 [Rhizobacter sp.]
MTLAWNRVAAGLAATVALSAEAQSPLAEWAFGAVLDTSYTTRPLALGARERGLQLGHSDLNATGPIGSHLRGNLTAVFATHDDKLEREIEEAWVETTRLPAGLQLRAGRFASQVGYLNGQHTHADDFSERPLLYRAFLGGHWNDDGVRLNWTVPTPFYWMLGLESLRGRRLVEAVAEPVSGQGVTTFVSKLGADVGTEHSWQLGVSHIRNRREASGEAHDHSHEEGHDHHHHHGAQFSGRKTWMVDAVWKWAPGGNNRGQQVRVGFEVARITGINRHARSNDRHEANAAWGVWRFHPSWEAGARSDWLRVRAPHGEHFHSGLLREASLMLAWKPTHLQTLRLQYAAQRDAVEFEAPARRSVQLQYVLSFGAHGAHSF